ncbi:MAG: BREX-1 system adenine-specific DNA-methyltransferase PglX [Faecalicoccus sp.]|uniref:BREX-1 system adenine-specific DNA-methyltransferase PglX n=1 Tax=Faecalicoccus sp. TaxID=1971758 RepID=UPI002F95DC79
MPYHQIVGIAKIFLNANKNDEYVFDFDNYQLKGNNIVHNKKIVYYNNQENFNNIPGMPIAYWITGKEFQLFSKYKKIGDIFETRGGMTTGNNGLFLRLWYEIDINKFKTGLSNEEAAKSEYKWFPYNKGGDYRKWYGNMNYVIDWFKDGKNIKNYKLEQRKINPNYNIAIAGLNSMFNPQISWSLVSAGNFGVRYYPQGFLFDVAGSSVLPNKENEKYVLAYLNSKVCDRYLKAFNPTINYQPGDIKSLIYINENKEMVDILSKSCIDISKHDWDSFETSWDFKVHPLIKEKEKFHYSEIGGKEYKLSDCYNHWQDSTEMSFNKLKENEEKLNEIFIDIYGLKDELTPEVEDKDITIRKADLGRDIKSLISYAVGCMFGRYSLDVEGLAYAGGEFDWNKYQSFIPDKDNIIPICDDEYFEDDIVGRFIKFVEVVYGESTLDENLSFIASVLGGKGSPREVIRNYFLNDFYNDHCKIYQKRPIYWLFDSGKKNGFKALMYIHRYQPDLIARLRTDYVHETQSRLNHSIEMINTQLDGNLTSSEKVRLNKELTKFKAQAEEVKKYEEIVHHWADKMEPMDLDDGVKVNYEKFKELLSKIK